MAEEKKIVSPQNLEDALTAVYEDMGNVPTATENKVGGIKSDASYTDTQNIIPSIEVNANTGNVKIYGIDYNNLYDQEVITSSVELHNLLYKVILKKCQYNSDNRLDEIHFTITTTDELIDSLINTNEISSTEVAHPMAFSLMLMGGNFDGNMIVTNLESGRKKYFKIVQGVDNPEFVDITGEDIPEIVTTITNSSTNDTVPGSKAVYDAIEASKVAIDTVITTSATDDHVPSSKAVKAYVDSIPKFDKQIVDTLPETGEDNVIYLIPNTLSENQNAKIEYMWINNAWEIVGSTSVDLTGYQKSPIFTIGDNTTKAKLSIVDTEIDLYPTSIDIPVFHVNPDGQQGGKNYVRLMSANENNAGLLSADMFTKLDSLSPITPMTDAEVTAMINRVKGVGT